MVAGEKLLHSQSCVYFEPLFFLFAQSKLSQAPLLFYEIHVNLSILLTFLIGKLYERLVECLFPQICEAF
jgi:hypothetical protein